MRWRSGKQSDNVEDRRGKKVATAGKVGIVGIIFSLILIYFTKGNLNLGDVMQAVQNNNAPQANVQAGKERKLTAKEKEMKVFLSVVLGDTETVWTKLFREQGRRYEKPTLVIFEAEVSTGCGKANSGVGPFYCPADKKLYIDPAFYHDLKNKLGAPGDFAQAYVIAHEVGHHIQNLLGTSGKVHQLQQGMSKADANRLSVMLELQADFYAGVWAHHAQKMRNILERGDIEEAMTAASAIGDDTLQKNARGYVQPETFTHGTSEQRVYWFQLGLKTGDFARGDDTFKELRR